MQVRAAQLMGQASLALPCPFHRDLGCVEPQLLVASGDTRSTGRKHPGHFTVLAMALLSKAVPTPLPLCSSSTTTIEM